MPQQPDPLDQRFERLRTVVSEWEEKRQLERLIPEMQEFIRKWEHTLTGASGLVP